MNFDDYKNKLPYPSKQYTIYVYKEGKVIETFDDEAFRKWKEVNGLNSMHNQYTVIHERVWINKEEYETQRKLYNDEDARLHAQFKMDLEREFGVENNPKKDLLFDKAYERGHSAGYSEVYSCYSDLVDLIL